MATTQTHTNVLGSLSNQYRSLFDRSEQAMYLYLDDDNKACNEKFAQMLGYKNAAEWSKVKGSFPTLFVAPESHETLIGTFQDSLEHGVGSAIPVTWKRKDGKTVESDCLLVPIDYDGHRVALHFIEPVVE